MATKGSLYRRLQTPDVCSWMDAVLRARKQEEKEAVKDDHRSDWMLYV
jgi:hypothetical protein